MSTRAQQAKILRDPTVLDQLAGVLLNAAFNVVNEATGTPNHANRIIFANLIFTNCQQAALVVAPGLMTNATIAGQAGNAAGASGTPFSDSDVEFVVASLFDVYANQAAAQQVSGAITQIAH
jgi:hypothetical protein